MQWLLFVVTLIVTAILQRLARASGAQIPVEARATLALGLLLLAAYVAGTLTHRLRLPRITGYLVAGLVAGPAWLGLIRFDELEVLSIVSNGALSLIAFGAGSQLSLGTLRGVNRRPLLHVMATALAVPFLLVTVVMLTVSPWFPLTAHQPFRDALVIALVLGAFATIGSPTLTWALMNDVGARREGPLSRSLVDVTILSTIAATVLVLVVLAIARPVASRGAVIPGSTMRAVLLLAASVAAGTVLGVLLAQYLRSSAIRVTWALVAVAFIIAQTMRLAGLDTVLVALTAGCAVRNLAPNEHARLDVELERCAVPVHVVFFALAGAALSFDPLTALGLWPWAVLLVALRINGLRWAFQLAGRWRGEAGGAGGELSRYGWLGLVSQGGMAITLAAVLRNAFPEWNVSLEALLVAMIGLHMLAGPICLQWALRRTGEVTEGRGEFDAPQTALVADGDSLVSRV